MIQAEEQQITTDTLQEMIDTAKELYQQQKNFLESLDWVGKVLAIDKNHYGALTLKINCLLMLGRYEQAIQVQSLGLLVIPDIASIPTDILKKYTYQLLWSRRFQELGELAERIFMIYPDSDLLELIIHTLGYKYRFQDLIRITDRALQINPIPTDLFKEIIKRLGLNNRYQELIALAERIIKINPIPTDALKEIIYQLGLNNRSQELIALAEKIIKINPIPTDALKEIIYQLGLNNRYQELIALAEEMAKVCPDSDLIEVIIDRLKLEEQLIVRLTNRQIKELDKIQEDIYTDSDLLKENSINILDIQLKGQDRIMDIRSQLNQQKELQRQTQFLLMHSKKLLKGQDRIIDIKSQLSQQKEFLRYAQILIQSMELLKGQNGSLDIKSQLNQRKEFLRYAQTLIQLMELLEFEDRHQELVRLAERMIMVCPDSHFQINGIIYHLGKYYYGYQNLFELADRIIKITPIPTDAIKEIILQLGLKKRDQELIELAERIIKINPIHTDFFDIITNHLERLSKIEKVYVFSQKYNQTFTTKKADWLHNLRKYKGALFQINHLQGNNIAESSQNNLCDNMEQIALKIYYDLDD